MTAPTPEPVSLSRRIARAIAEFSSERLTDEVITKVKIGLLDLLACAYEARELPWGRQAIEIASRTKGGNATVIGTEFRASPSDAAFANAVLGHGLVREDMHTAAVSHLGVVIYPTLLALAQEYKARGRDFVAAAVCGYEVGASIGRVLMDADIVRRFRPTGITGPIAGAAAGCRLLGLDETATVSAIGLAANCTGGLNEWPYTGSDEMFFHPGFAARNAVTAVELAKAGMRASETALDGTSGLFAGLGKREQVGAVTPFSREAVEILSVYYKPAPACNYAQTACQAALAIEAPVEEIAGITVRASAAAVNYPGCSFAGPFERILQAKMSIPYCVAATLVRHAIEEANYRFPADPEILRLAGLIRLEIDAEFTAAYPGAQGSEVQVALRDGRVLSHRMRDLAPASAAEIRARFQAARGEGATEIAKMVFRLHGLERIETLGEMLGTP